MFIQLVKTTKVCMYIGGKGMDIVRKMKGKIAKSVLVLSVMLCCALSFGSVWDIK